MMQKTKRQNFIRVAEKRVNNALRALRVLKGMARSGTTYYEYSDADVERIVGAVLKELAEVDTKLKLARTRPGTGPVEFSL